MSSFDWLELENLTTDIDLLRDQLIEARSRKAIARVRGLEEEIARSEARRDKLLGHLTINMISDAEIRTNSRLRLPGSYVEHRASEPSGVVERRVPASRSQAAATRAGNEAGCSEILADDTSALMTAASTAEGKRWERGILVLAHDGESSPHSRTLEPLTHGIEICRVRLAVAKLRKDSVLVDRLVQQIVAGEARRKHLLEMARLEDGTGAQIEHYTDTVKDPVPEDEARQNPKFQPQTDSLPGDTEHPLSELCEQCGALEANPHLGAEEANDESACAWAPVREPPPNKVENKSTLATAEDHDAASDADASSPNNTLIEKPFQAEVGNELPLLDISDDIAAIHPLSSTSDPKVDNTEGATIMWDQSELELAKNEIESRRDEMLERHGQELRAMLLKQAEELRQLENDRDELQALEQAIGAALRKFKAPSENSSVTSLDDERASRQQGLS